MIDAYPNGDGIHIPHFSVECPIEGYLSSSTAVLNDCEVNTICSTNRYDASGLC